MTRSYFFVPDQINLVFLLVYIIFFLNTSNYVIGERSRGIKDKEVEEKGTRCVVLLAAEKAKSHH